MLPHIPNIFRELIEGLSDEELNRKPGRDRFSIAEVLAHVADVERRGYGPRIRLLATADNPDFPAYQAPGALAGTARENLDEFTRLRRENVEFLASLPEGATSRPGVHSRLGAMTLDNVLAETAYHDLGHVKQICELVRWLQHHPRMGPFQREYSVKP